MTPTLPGRWQTRIFLLAMVGLVISLLVGLSIHDFLTPLAALGYVLLLGVVWDVLYQYIQSFRWDRDWPTSFQVVAGILEGIVLWSLIQTGILPGITRNLPFSIFLWQYGSTWLCLFLLTQGPLRILWPKWRYHGGQWLRRARPPRSIQTGQVKTQQYVPVEPGTTAANLYNCSCGYTSERQSGKYCPQCGKPRVL